MVTPLVLVHGGGFDSRCWDRLLPELGGPALAVDLPGRGRHPAPMGSVTLASCAETVAADVDSAGFDDVILVGHSLAGCSMPFIAARLGSRVRHAVFIACTVPEDGQSARDTLDPSIQALIAEADPGIATGVMDGEMARLVLGDDLDEAQLAWCTERLVPEALRLTTDQVSLDGLRGVRSTWVRTMLDQIVAPDKQLRFSANLTECRVDDIDAGHMCMVSQPAHVAEILNVVAA
jgi:pimeloyl-ACP methyl ester carboxylesterase